MILNWWWTILWLSVLPLRPSPWFEGQRWWVVSWCGAASLKSGLHLSSFHVPGLNGMLLKGLPGRLYLRVFFGPKIFAAYCGSPISRTLFDTPYAVPTLEPRCPLTVWHILAVYPCVATESRKEENMNECFSLVDLCVLIYISYRYNLACHKS
jgi:hypothetical protein